MKDLLRAYCVGPVCSVCRI